MQRVSHVQKFLKMPSKMKAFRTQSLLGILYLVYLCKAAEMISQSREYASYNITLNNIFKIFLDKT